ncbi:hypothetical protein NDU88_006613 [Pleurodeles waltl]|uniref:Uncharacterized protein n=1 Tax=Pleurodeles waltl TaxID=8319 RepID=A0AAV7QI78_PLEWA|nr:hypothetical protein NDU88_006613 [Pleurodeles waltl]
MEAVKAFHEVKVAVLHDATMVYFDPKCQTELIIYTSLVSLGALLMLMKNSGEWVSIAYAVKHSQPSRPGTLSLKGRCWPSGGQYSFIVVYRPGMNNAADYLSCHPLTQDPQEEGEDEVATEGFVNMVTEMACPRGLSVMEIVEATKENTCLKRVNEALRGCQWKNILDRLRGLIEVEHEARKQHWQYCDELSESE